MQDLWSWRTDDWWLTTIHSFLLPGWFPLPLPYLILERVEINGENVFHLDTPNAPNPQPTPLPTHSLGTWVHWSREVEAWRRNLAGFRLLSNCYALLYFRCCFLAPSGFGGRVTARLRVALGFLCKPKYFLFFSFHSFIYIIIYFLFVLFIALTSTCISKDPPKYPQK